MDSNFQPKQKEAWRALLDDDVKYLLYGGAAGGGKSYFLRWAAIGLGFYFYERYGTKGVTLGLFCEDYPALKDRQITKIKKEIPPELGRLVESRDEGYIFEAVNGVFKILLRNLDDPAKYASVEFAAVFVDELTKNPVDTFDDLRFRLRYPGIPSPKFVGATNPGGIGHAWVKQKWIQSDPTKPDREQNRFLYIPSKVYDNEYIDKSYVLQLESLPEQKRKAFLEGSWDIFAGQVFSEWGEKHIVKPFPIPDHWKRYLSLDPGYNAPFSLNWYAVDEQGHHYKYRQIKLNGDGFQLKYGYPLTATRLAEVIIQINKDANEDYDYCAAGPDLWNRDLSVNPMKDGVTEGESAAETMLRLGIKLLKAPAGPNYRYNKMQRYHEMLAEAPDGKPWYQVFSTCYDTIHSIPSLVYDEHQIEDVDTKGDDHDYDADCMFFMSRPSPAQAIVPEKSLIEEAYNRVRMQREGKYGTQGW